MKILYFILVSSIFLSCSSKHLAVVKQNGKFGAIDKKGTFVIEPKWDFILLDDKGKPALVENSGLYGYINRKGEILINPKYNDGDLFSEGLALVSNNEDKYGYINIEGDTVIDFQFEENAWGDFSKGLADVVYNEKSGYIDKTGQFVISPQFEICYPFRSDIAVVMDTAYNHKLIDMKGNLFDYNDENIGNRKIFPPKETYPGAFKTENGRGRLSEKGDTIIPPNYLSTGNLSNGMHIVQAKNEKWGAFDAKGNLVIEPQFDGMWHFYEGVSNFNLNNQYGFVNKKGEIVIEPKFDYASQFSNGLAYVELEGKAGFIDKNGIVVIPIIYELNRGSRFE
jgi:hypothetical protein